MSQKERQAGRFREAPVVLGRREQGGKGALCLGRYHALDGSAGAAVYVDALHPHVVLICGKRGYGKSYTIGVFLEEFLRLEPEVRENLGVVVVDTLGIFWTMAYPATLGKDGGRGMPVRVFVPEGAVDRARRLGIEAVPYAVRASDLSVAAWCHLFKLSPMDPVGIVLTKAILSIREVKPEFSLEDIRSWLQKCTEFDSLLRVAAGNLLELAESWGIFSSGGVPVKQLVQAGEVSVLDISYLQSVELKDTVVALVADQIFEARVLARKSYERERLGLDPGERGLPMAWLAVDEAQVFLPSQGTTLSKEVLVSKWMRQGRQPGLSLIMATQRPSAVDEEVFAHSDLVVCHRVTAQEDLVALARVRPEYLAGDIGSLIRQLGREKGVAVLVDDTSESAHVVRIRPRLTWHAGEEPVALPPGKG